MTNPSLVVPDALQPLLDLTKILGKVGVPQLTFDLIRLRVSQINGREIRVPDPSGEEDDARTAQVRMARVAGWREESVYTDAERAALALAEEITRLSDRDNPVTDEVWDAAVAQFSEQELGAVVMQIGLVNLWNRVNVATRQVPADMQ